MFAILSKVGIYVVLRLWLLLFGDGAGASAGFGGAWLLFGGLLTIAFGTIGVLASQNLARLAGYSVLVSSGTLLAAIGIGQVAVTGGALFYLVSSTLGDRRLLSADRAGRARPRGRRGRAGRDARKPSATSDEDELDEEEEIGVAIPATMAVLGLSFVGCALLLAGLPPLSGFVAKFAMLARPARLRRRQSPSPPPGRCSPLLILSGLATVDRHDPRRHRRLLGVPASAVPRVRVIEIAPVVLLLAPVPGADRRRPGR